jgi:hypothetical protein
MSPVLKYVAILICATFFVISAFKGGGLLLDAARLIWDNERTTGRVVSVDAWASPWKAWVEYDTPKGKGRVSFKGSRRHRLPVIGDAVPVIYYAGDPTRVAARDADGDVLFRPLVGLMVAAASAVAIFKLTRPMV